MYGTAAQAAGRATGLVVTLGTAEQNCSREAADQVAGKKVADTGIEAAEIVIETVLGRSGRLEPYEVAMLQGRGRHIHLLDG